MTLGFITDGLLYSRHHVPAGTRTIATDGGDVHVRTSGDPAAPAIVLVPDGRSWWSTTTGSSRA